LKYTASVLEKMGYKKLPNTSGGKKNTESRLKYWKNRGYNAKSIKGSTKKTGKYINREIWTKKKKSK